MHLEDGKITIQGDGCKIVMEGGKIILDGEVYLGSASASRAVAALGSVDSDGDAEVGNLLTKVFGV